MQVYSTPITPPPTTISVFGISGICRIWSLLMMLRPLIGTFGDDGRLGAGGDDDRCRLRTRWLAARALDANVVRIDETGDAVQHFDAVARKLRLGDVDLGLDHMLDPEGQVRHGDLFFTR